jgi:ATP-dependent DNA helicase RecQ
MLSGIYNRNRLPLYIPEVMMESSSKRRKVADSDIDHAITLATKKLGYNVLKAEQYEAIRKFAEGNYVFVCLPTGYGKSLCYFCLPSVHDILNNHTSKWSVDNYIN